MHAHFCLVYAKIKHQFNSVRHRLNLNELRLNWFGVRVAQTVKNVSSNIKVMDFDSQGLHELKQCV